MYLVCRTIGLCLLIHILKTDIERFLRGLLIHILKTDIERFLCGLLIHIFGSEYLFLQDLEVRIFIFFAW
jgi:hypothetical protein